MAKLKSMFFCQSCGAQSSKWLGKCPSCNSWNTYVEEVVSKEKVVGSSDKKGVFIVMLYAKGSFNYWFRIQLYFRLMFLASLIKRKFGLKIKETWTSHLNNLDNKGWAYFSWKEWPHHCTDGPDCEVANIYTKKEVKTMLEAKGFKIEKMKKAHFPAGLPPKLERKLASLFGFHLIVWATKVNS